MSSQSCQAYNLEALFDSGTRHSGIYVVTGDTSGQFFHVRSTLKDGEMGFQRDYYMDQRPESITSGVTLIPIGSVKMDQLDKLEEICRAVRLPTINDPCQCATWAQQAHTAAKSKGIIS